MRSCACARLRIKQQSTYHLPRSFSNALPGYQPRFEGEGSLLLDNDIGPDNFELDIAEIFGVSPRSIQRRQRNVDLYGSVIPPKNHL